jgi:PPOX class probable F420-dependent enzyme
MAQIPESHSDLLTSNAFAHIASISPKGEIQSSPVWFGWDGEHVLFSLTKGRQKYRNILNDGRIALSLIDPQNPYRYLEIRGKVVRIDEDPDLTFINSMAKKYLNQDKYPWHQPEDERVVIVVEPQRFSKMG